MLIKYCFCDFLFQGYPCMTKESVCYEMGKTSISMFEILEPGGSALGKDSILRGLNSIALGYLNFTAGLT